MSKDGPDIVVIVSLRDYFAAAALQGIRSRDWVATSAMLADWAYKDADAMLAEREKEQK